VLKPYQVQRLTGFLHPSHDPRNQTYNITESLIAIGSGQKTGRGVAHATQTSLHFLPENQTDFIFAVVGETYGFVGAALVLLLYALVIWRALRILTMAKNLYGTLIVGGIRPDNMQPWLDAGATGFGLGSGLYKPGQSESQTHDKARAYVAGLRA